MSIRYDQDDAGRLVTLTVEGTLTLEELADAADRQAAASVWSYGVLLDSRARTGAPLTTADIRALVEYHGHVSTRYGPAGPWGIVPGDEVGYGMGRMFQTLNEPTARAVVVVYAFDEARAWLAEQMS